MPCSAVCSCCPGEEHHCRGLRARAAWARAPPPPTGPGPGGRGVPAWACSTPTSDGPSQPMMLGINRRPESDDGKTMEPLENYGVQVMSIGFPVDQDEAMIWRGPMATQALEQLLAPDQLERPGLPHHRHAPGTGDIQLTLSQRVPMTGAVIVTTRRTSRCWTPRRASRCSRRWACPSWASSRTWRPRVQQLRPCGAHLWRRWRQEDGDRLRHGLPGRAAR